MPRLHMSLYSDGDRNLVLKFIDHDKPPAEWDVFEHKIAPDEQGYVLAQIANMVNSNLNDVMRDVLRGDCPTCRNFRLVDTVAPGGRKSNEYCPDCTAGQDTKPFEHYPIVGGGLAPRES